MAIGDKSNQTTKLIIKHQVGSTEKYVNQTLTNWSPSATNAQFARYADSIGSSLIDNENYPVDGYYRQNQFDIAMS